MIARDFPERRWGDCSPRASVMSKSVSPRPPHGAHTAPHAFLSVKWMESSSIYHRCQCCTYDDDWSSQGRAGRPRNILPPKTQSSLHLRLNKSERDDAMRGMQLVAQIILTTCKCCHSTTTHLAPASDSLHCTALLLPLIGREGDKNDHGNLWPSIVLMFLTIFILVIYKIWFFFLNFFWRRIVLISTLNC